MIAREHLGNGFTHQTASLNFQKRLEGGQGKQAFCLEVEKKQKGAHQEWPGAMITIRQEREQGLSSLYIFQSTGYSRIIP